MASCAGDGDVRFNHAKVNEIARERWGLSWPVYLERRTRKLDLRTGLYTVKSGRAGRHVAAWRPLPDGTIERAHRIQLTNHPAVQYMLETLAHELEHGRQKETVGMHTHALLYSGFKPARERLGWRTWGASHQFSEEWERGAERAEARWRELLPCVTQTRGAT